MKNDLQAIQSDPTLAPATQEYVSQIVDLHVKLTNAWADLRSASQTESSRAFYAAVVAIYSAERRLNDLVRTGPTTGIAACAESVQ
jgi:hypothetical protein